MEYAWIASRDHEVETVLQHEDLHVRPPDKQVPDAMKGTALAEIFACLVRMNEGERHRDLRRDVERRISTWDEPAIRTLTMEAAKNRPHSEIAAFVIATLIGLTDIDAAVAVIPDFAAALAGGASKDDVARGIPAAQRLLQLVPAGGNMDEDANALGFLFQAYAATAALIENRLRGISAPPVPMTRRWAAKDIDICGAHLKKGDAVVVLLTSQRFYFGCGRHRCPGEHVAQTIADAAVEAIKSVGVS